MAIETYRKAIAAAHLAFNAHMQPAAELVIDNPVGFSTLHLALALPTNAGRALYLRSGFVHLGRCRSDKGHTNIWVRSELAQQFGSATEAYREIQRCEKN